MKNFKKIIFLFLYAVVFYFALIIGVLSLASDFNAYLEGIRAESEKETALYNEKLAERQMNLNINTAMSGLKQFDFSFQEKKDLLYFVSQIIKDIYNADSVTGQVPIRHYNDFQFAARYNDIIFSERHSANVSFERMSYKFASAAGRQRLIGYVSKLSSMNGFLKHMYDSHRKILWIYIILDEGVLFQYPGSASYPEDGNFSAEEWYRKTSDLKDFNITYGADNIIHFNYPLYDGEFFLGAVSVALKSEEFFQDSQTAVLHEQYGVLFNNTDLNISGLRDFGRDNADNFFSAVSGTFPFSFSGKEYKAVFLSYENVFFVLSSFLKTDFIKDDGGFLMKPQDDITKAFNNILKKYLMYLGGVFFFIFMIFMPAFILIFKKDKNAPDRAE